MFGASSEALTEDNRETRGETAGPLGQYVSMSEPHCPIARLVAMHVWQLELPRQHRGYFEFTVEEMHDRDAALKVGKPMYLRRVGPFVLQIGLTELH